MLIDGITDEEAKIVALLWGTHKFSSTVVSVLLDGTRLHLEERTIQLPLAGEVLITIIRFRDQRTASMDLLEHSIRRVNILWKNAFPPIGSVCCSWKT